MTLRYDLGKTYSGPVTYYPALADSRQFPAASIRVTPAPARSVCKRGAPIPRRALKIMHVSRARTALYLIGQLLAPGMVWMPAYHCPSMVEPLSAGGCKIAFYPLDTKLCPQLEFLSSRVKSGDAVLGVRYFGFDTGTADIATLCERKGAAFIEDLAHAIYFQELRGTFGISSFCKFFPVSHGGELLLPEDSEYASLLLRRFSDLPTVRRVQFKATLRRLARWTGLAPLQSPKYRHFALDQLHRGITRYNYGIMGSGDHCATAKRRQANYTYLATALTGNHNGAPVFSSLPKHVVPYVFPFLLRDPTSFDRIRRARIQALRWEELAPSGCDVSNNFRGRLIQLPVHQDLDQQDLNCVIATLNF